KWGAASDALDRAKANLERSRPDDRLRCEPPLGCRGADAAVSARTRRRARTRRCRRLQRHHQAVRPRGWYVQAHPRLRSLEPLIAARRRLAAKPPNSDAADILRIAKSRLFQAFVGSCAPVNKNRPFQAILTDIG